MLSGRAGIVRRSRYSSSMATDQQSEIWKAYHGDWIATHHRQHEWNHGSFLYVNHNAVLMDTLTEAIAVSNRCRTQIHQGSCCHDGLSCRQLRSLYSHVLLLQSREQETRER